MKYSRYAILAMGLVLTACGQDNQANPADNAPAETPAAETTAPSEPAAQDALTYVSWTTLDGEPTDIIAHRGASGLLPEHTLAAYERAIDLGADWIEPDLVMTKDGVLVCRHDRYLSTTTDVASRSEFAGRKTTKTLNGKPVEDWWVEDFTLAELKTLRAVQPRAGRSQDFNGQFEIPSFAEAIALAKARSTPERPIRLVPETKHPSFFQDVGLDMEAALLTALNEAGWREKTSPVMIQSFEPGILQSLRAKTDVRLIQLVFVENAPAALILRTSAAESNLAMDAYAEFVDGVGPQKELVVAPDGEVSDFITRAHEKGLAVYPRTFRDDQRSLDGAPIEVELIRMYEAGADGVFTDFPGSAAMIRDAVTAP